MGKAVDTRKSRQVPETGAGEADRIDERRQRGRILGDESRRKIDDLRFIALKGGSNAFWLMMVWLVFAAIVVLAARCESAAPASRDADHAFIVPLGRRQHLSERGQASYVGRSGSGRIGRHARPGWRPRTPETSRHSQSRNVKGHFPQTPLIGRCFSHTEILD